MPVKAFPIFLLLLVILAGGSATGCATTKPLAQTPAGRGALQRPEPNLFWWELLGFFLVPTAQYFSDER